LIPLRFVAGFARYGAKADLSDRAFPIVLRLNSLQHTRHGVRGLHPPLVLCAARWLLRSDTVGPRRSAGPNSHSSLTGSARAARPYSRVTRRIGGGSCLPIGVPRHGRSVRSSRRLRRGDRNRGMARNASCALPAGSEGATNLRMTFSPTPGQSAIARTLGSEPGPRRSAVGSPVRLTAVANLSVAAHSARHVQRQSWAVAGAIATAPFPRDSLRYDGWPGEGAPCPSKHV
jgi:hypothetical protein